MLTDFGEARLRGSAHTGLIQPIQYRAPEVLFGMPWDYKVDIWNVGVMVSFDPVFARVVSILANVCRCGIYSRATTCSRLETLRMSRRWNIT